MERELDRLQPEIQRLVTRIAGFTSDDQENIDIACEFFLQALTGRISKFQFCSETSGDIRARFERLSLRYKINYCDNYADRLIELSRKVASCGEERDLTFQTMLLLLSLSTPFDDTNGSSLPEDLPPSGLDGESECRAIIDDLKLPPVQIDDDSSDLDSREDSAPSLEELADEISASVFEFGASWNVILPQPPSPREPQLPVFQHQFWNFSKRVSPVSDCFLLNLYAQWYDNPLISIDRVSLVSEVDLVREILLSMLSESFDCSHWGRLSLSHMSNSCLSAALAPFLSFRDGVNQLPLDSLLSTDFKKRFLAVVSSLMTEWNYHNTQSVCSLITLERRLSSFFDELPMILQFAGVKQKTDLLDQMLRYLRNQQFHEIVDLKLAAYFTRLVVLYARDVISSMHNGCAIILPEFWKSHGASLGVAAQLSLQLIKHGHIIKQIPLAKSLETYSVENAIEDSVNGLQHAINQVDIAYLHIMRNEYDVEVTIEWIWRICMWRDSVASRGLLDFLSDPSNFLRPGYANRLFFGNLEDENISYPDILLFGDVTVGDDGLIHLPLIFKDAWPLQELLSNVIKKSLEDIFNFILNVQMAILSVGRQAFFARKSSTVQTKSSAASFRLLSFYNGLLSYAMNVIVQPRLASGSDDMAHSNNWSLFLISYTSSIIAVKSGLLLGDKAQTLQNHIRAIIALAKSSQTPEIIWDSLNNESRFIGDSLSTIIRSSSVVIPKLEVLHSIMAVI